MEGKSGNVIDLWEESENRTKRARSHTFKGIAIVEVEDFSLDMGEPLVLEPRISDEELLRRHNCTQKHEKNATKNTNESGSEKGHLFQLSSYNVSGTCSFSQNDANRAGNPSGRSKKTIARHLSSKDLRNLRLASRAFRNVIFVRVRLDDSNEDLVKKHGKYMRFEYSLDKVHKALDAFEEFKRQYGDAAAKSCGILSCSS